jgi:hypothetical protein
MDYQNPPYEFPNGHDYDQPRFLRLLRRRQWRRRWWRRWRL